MITLLFEFGYCFLEIGHLLLQVAFNTFQCHKISSFPLIFLGVLVGLSLHLLSDADPLSLGVYGKTLRML